MKKLSLISKEVIENKIYIIRGMKVMFDRDLAELYQVETKVLIQAVKRNTSRFPVDFMFQLSKKEFINWRSQFVTSNFSKKMFDVESILSTLLALIVFGITLVFLRPMKKERLDGANSPVFLFMTF